MKPIYLYHGSPTEIGGVLTPTKGKDVKNRPANLHIAVYASDSKEIAIAMALVQCKGVKSSSVRFNQNPPAIIYEGWPEQDEIYLYTLSPDKFVQTNMKKQWMSLISIKPLKIEKLKVSDYSGLIRRASDDEKAQWLKNILS